MININSITSENNNKQNKKWSCILEHPYRILIIGGSRSGKTNTLIILIKKQDYNDVTDKIYLYGKDLEEPKYQCLIEKREYTGIKHKNDLTAYFKCSNTIDDVYESIDYYNTRRDRDVLIVFDDMIADVMTNKKFHAISKELFIRCRKLSISLFITQCYFSVPKDVRLSLTHYLIMKINNRKELQNIATNYSVDIDYKDFMKTYR